MINNIVSISKDVQLIINYLLSRNKSKYEYDIIISHSKRRRGIHTGCANKYASRTSRIFAKYPKKVGLQTFIKQTK